MTDGDIRQRLREKVLLADGAMGTQLHQRGVGFEQNFDVLNVERPDLVSDVHLSYVEAGADLILTNTFCANPIHLDRWGLGHRSAEINRAAVGIARSAAASSSRSVIVAGSIGPIGERLSPAGPVSTLDAESAFREQITTFYESRVDVLWFETFSDLHELDLAIRVARTLGDLPIVASLTLTRDGYTVLGATPEVLMRHLLAQRVDGVGVNCSTGPLAVTKVVERFSLVLANETTENRPVVAAMPNAGFPENRGARLFYPATPTYLAESTVRLADVGAGIIGGCCGTTPEHIRAMRNALDRRGTNVATPAKGVVFPNIAPAPAMPTQETSALATALQASRFVVTVEMEPPRSADTGELEHHALLLRQAGATVLDISDIPMARLRMTGLAAATRVQTTTGLETILHFPVRGRNLLRVQGDLLAAHALGIRNLFVTMGDPSAIGDYPQAFDNHDIVPTGLVRLIKEKFNKGVDSAGSSIGAPCQFVVGAATNLTPHDVAHEIKLLQRKVEAGADFLLTQPVFDPTLARSFLSQYQELHGPLEVPILLGVLPLATARHANFLNNEVPGMSLPAAVIDAMTNAGSDGREVGLQIAASVVAELRDLVAGVYVIPAFRRYDIVGRLIESLLGKPSLP